MAKVERGCAGAADALPDGENMNRITNALASALACALSVSTAACDTPAPEQFQLPGAGAPTERLLHDNGLMMNGLMMNGLMMNGLMMNGPMVNGLMMNGLMMNGTTVEGVDVTSALAPDGESVTSITAGGQDGALTVTTAGDSFAGAAVIGTRLHYHDALHGYDYRFTIDGAQLHQGYEQGAIYQYTISVELDEGQGWGAKVSACYDSEGAPVDALLLPGRWDGSTGAKVSSAPDDVTIACRRAAIAKCFELDYRLAEPSERWMHSACIRMLRADYEGDGTGYTVNGTRIYLGDTEGYNEQDSHPGWLVKEAVWGPDGAICVNRDALRKSGLTICDDARGDCFAEVPDCGGDPSDLWAGIGAGEQIPNALVTAVSVNAFDTDTHIYGVKTPSPGHSALFMSTGFDGSMIELGELREEDQGGPVAEVDALFFTSDRGLMGAQIENGAGVHRSRIVKINGDATIEPVSTGWIEDRVLRGAATVAESEGLQVAAIDARHNELCFVWTSDGELEGCHPVSFAGDALDFTHNVDLIQIEELGAPTFLIADGDSLYELDTSDREDLVAVAAGSVDASILGLAQHPYDDTQLILDRETDKLYLMDEPGPLESLNTPLGPVMFGDLASAHNLEESSPSEFCTQNADLATILTASNGHSIRANPGQDNSLDHELFEGVDEQDFEFVAHCQPDGTVVLGHDGRFLAEYGLKAHVQGSIDVRAQWTPVELDAENNEWALQSHDGRYLTLDDEPGGHGVSLVFGMTAATSWTL